MSTKNENTTARRGGIFVRLWSWFRRTLGLKLKPTSLPSVKEPTDVDKLPAGKEQSSGSTKLSRLKGKLLYFKGTGRDPLEGKPEWYREAYKVCAIKPGEEKAVKNAVKRILWGKRLYLKVAEETGLEWWILGGIHSLEADCNFQAVLHNGERIIGTGEKTRLVPKGRGPFESWPEAAIDAIGLNPYRWVKIREAGPEIGLVLEAVESFNGRGYISGAGKATVSPYLWSKTNVYTKGKYVSDGKFDPSVVSKQVGFVAIVKELERLGEITIQIADS